MPKNRRPRQFNASLPGFHLEADIANAIRRIAAANDQDISTVIRRALKLFLATGLTEVERAAIDNHQENVPVV